MKIALVAYGSRGDVQPLLALAHGLRRAGHVPLLCVAPDFEAWTRSSGFEFRSLGSSMQHFFALAERSHLHLIAELRREAARHVRDIESAVQGVDLILWATGEVAIPTIAEALGIPNRYVAFCPTPLHSPAHAPPYVPWTSQRPWFNEMTWRVLRSVVNLFSRKTLNRLRAERDLDPIRDVFLHAISRQSILAADPVLAPAPPDLAGETIQTGAWLLQQDDALDPRIEEFLAEGEPPIFIGFGSMSDRRAARTRAMLLEAIAGGGCRALLAGSTAIERLAPGVLGIGAAPHEKLFPRVRVVVHHGGAGTTTVAASAGAAQVVVPHGFDQFYWADRVRSLGVGTTVRRSRLTAPRLTAALRLALSEPMHLRARELSREIAGDGVVRAVQFIERECVR